MRQMASPVVFPSLAVQQFRLGLLKERIHLLVLFQLQVSIVHKEFHGHLDDCQPHSHLVFGERSDLADILAEVHHVVHKLQLLSQLLVVLIPFHHRLHRPESLLRIHVGNIVLLIQTLYGGHTFVSFLHALVEDVLQPLPQRRHTYRQAFALRAHHGHQFAIQPVVGSHLDDLLVESLKQQRLRVREHGEHHRAHAL